MRIADRIIGFQLWKVVFAGSETVMTEEVFGLEGFVGVVNGFGLFSFASPEQGFRLCNEAAIFVAFSWLFNAELYPVFELTFLAVSFVSAAMSGDG